MQANAIGISKDVETVGLSETIKALGDSTRREILVMLKEGTLNAGEIASHLALSNATVSYHLSQLKNANLIIETKKKNFIYYELNTSVFEEIMLWCSNFTKEEPNEKQDPQ